MPDGARRRWMRRASCWGLASPPPRPRQPDDSRGLPKGEPGRRAGASVSATNGLLKMSELAERSGVSAGTIKHYLREGLLPEPVRTSRNMAYYPEQFVERIRLIKRLQEERFLPLRLIKGVLDRAAAQESKRVSRAE